MNYDNHITAIMDNLLIALSKGYQAEAVEDAVSKWRDIAINDDDRDHDLVDLVADAMTDAIRQIGERREKLCAIRITKPDGGLIIFAWRPEEDGASPTFNQAVMGAVKRALGGERDD